ncbi:MAG: RNA-binding protein [Candidatus Cloacimonetes bacterium HGW-Cloacimonetes-1]|jgi:spoIIIJ-associated protein|nr:MAG: RNA-binding protein [Candidatus Cloacimonetes bacterium HGW-Cloacimonetes-1]
MKIIEMSGSSLEEIISKYRLENNIKEWELEYDVVSKASSGLFGLFGKREAVIKFKLPEIEDRVRMFLETLLDKVGVTYAALDVKKVGKTVYAEIKNSNDPGFLIGKNGSMLETIQFLLNRTFENQREIDKIYLDTEDYRMRKEDQYIRQYIPRIDRVKTDAQTLTLEPMSAGERRIIHKYVERDKNLRTLTVGEGDKKRIVIFHSKQNEKEVMEQVRGPRAPRKPAPKPKAETAVEGTETADKPVKPRPKYRPRRPNNNPRPPKEPTE